MIWCERHRHHAVVCEIEQSEIHDESVVEELLGSPFEAHHRVGEQGEEDTLNQTVGNFDQRLHKQTSGLDV